MIDARNVDEDKFYAIEGRDIKRIARVMLRLHSIKAIGHDNPDEQWDLAKQLELVFDHGIEVQETITDPKKHPGGDLGVIADAILKGRG